MHTLKFDKLAPNSAFSPILGAVGSTNVYIKKPNGICPQVGVKGSEGIFWPDDRVVPVKLPDSIMRHYK